MSTADHIIADLGGSAAISKATGWPLTTIEGWRSANFVPEWRRPRLIELASALGKSLAENDFPPVSARKSRTAPTPEQSAEGIAA